MMDFTRALFILTLTSFMLTVSSCGQKGAAKTDFKLSLGGVVTGTPMAGGIYLWAVEVDEATGTEMQTLMFDLDAADSAVIPFGTWKLYLVGYEGPSAWSGNNYCGNIPNTILENPEQTVSISISQAECGVLPIYADMINAKAASLGPAVATWDVSTWDNAVWGP